MQALAPSENIRNGIRRADGLVVTGNPVWAKAPHDKIAGFGEFHWHTEASGDGGCSMILGMTTARDHMNMNYCMPSDHSPAAPKWAYNTKIMNQFNKPNQFVTLFGWENSTSEGHDNYYFLDPDHPMKPFGQANIMRKKPYQVQEKLDSLQQSLPDLQKFIAIPHHTNAVAETRKPDGTPYWFQYPFTHGDSYHRLIEIFQARGNMERNEYPDAWRGWYNHFDSSVQDALDMGYKAGFTAGTDNHVSRPGRCFAAIENFGRIPGYSQSLTGIWTDQMDRNSVFKSLFNRHTWAAWDTRALVYFTINGALSGNEIKVEMGTPIKARIKMSSEDALQSIEIVSEREPVWIDTIDDLDFDISVDLGTADRSTHFYLRALLRNGGIVYASPVFVGVE
jgi:hypothetical protein